MAERKETVVPVAEDGGDASLVQRIDELGQRLSSTSLSESSGCFGRPGSQLEEKLVFKSKVGKSVWAYPVLVDFRRLLQLGQVSKTSGVIPGISNQDLLHAVVGLYETCLSDMDADCIYDTICENGARTIVLVRDLHDTMEDMTARRIQKIQDEEDRRKKEADADKTDEKNSDDEEDDDDDDDKDISPEDDILDEEDEIQSTFAEVFSDTDNEEEEDEEEEEEETEEANFTKGIRTFIRNAKQRRAKREECENSEILLEHVGIENMLMGCASFEKKMVCNNKERVIHLTFIGVRKRARKFQMGRYLLSKCLDPSVVGRYDAMVVHADHGATDFFAKFGFTDDLLLNSKWSELAEQFTQCTLMCYIPGFSLAGTEMVEVTKTLQGDSELSEIEEEFKKWQMKSLEAYQSQNMCMRKLQQEILQLKTLSRRQSEEINKLLEENERMRHGKVTAECDLLTYRLETARSAFRVVANNGDVPRNLSDHSDEEDIVTEALLKNLEQKSSQVESNTQVLKKFEDVHYLISGGPDRNMAAYDHAEDVSFFSDIAAQFRLVMASDLSVRMQYEVSSILKAVLPSIVEERFCTCVRGMSDPSMVTKLYYCGTLEKPQRAQEILSNGFSSDDFTHGEYGYALYFSKYPSKAAQFSALGKLVLADVGLGNMETVTKEDRTRKSPSPGFDSIITPGRLHRSDGDSRDSPMCQEYVVFHTAQAKPLCLLTYQAASK